MAQPAESVTSRGTALKIVLSVVVVTGAIGFLLMRSVKDTGAQYYKEVAEVTSNFDAVRGKHLQVHGFVVLNSIEQAKGTLQYRFKIGNKPRGASTTITAVYTGLVPDTFKSDAEVVATGMLAADNSIAVAPDGIMAKCPSKYNADSPAAAAAEAEAAAAKLAPKL